MFSSDQIEGGRMGWGFLVPGLPILLFTAATWPLSSLRHGGPVARILNCYGRLERRQSC
jgi:hypothetical protein